MAMYEYACLRCEHLFEERRPMGAAVDIALACPSCGSDRVARRFSFLAGRGSSASHVPGSSGACACGGACRGWRPRWC